MKALFRTLLLVVLASASFAEESSENDFTGKRIVFLGDSVTQAGDFLVDIECWLESKNYSAELLNLALSSETVTELTESERQVHLKRYGFPRPDVGERFDRVLQQTAPDWLFLCYGINDSGILPNSTEGVARYASAMSEFRKRALKAGVERVFVCTPPMYDAANRERDQWREQVTERYSTWLRAQRLVGWEVIDIHGPMQKTQQELETAGSTLRLSPDGIHPNREGHWAMAQAVIAQMFHGKSIEITQAEEFFPEKGKEIRELIFQRMKTRFEAWMTATGHQRPHIPGGPKAKKGLPLEESEKMAAKLARQIREMRGFQGKE